MILFLLAIFLCSIAHSLCSESVSDVFAVKPGGQTMEFQKEWNNYKCTFIYQAQGGTHEEWKVTMETTDDQTLICTIARYQTSYLYFQTFTMSLTGPAVTLQQFEAINTGSTLLAENEYKMDPKTNSLSDVPGQFKNHLERITLVASIGKTEL